MELVGEFNIQTPVLNFSTRGVLFMILRIFYYEMPSFCAIILIMSMRRLE